MAFFICRLVRAWIRFCGFSGSELRLECFCLEWWNHENKIKSNINGVRYDPYTGDYSNQLIKYYNIIEKNYKTQNRHYYIFKPDYNNISIDNLKSCLSSDTTNTSSKIKEILDNYNIINYSKLFKVLNKERKNKGKMYKDFVNALKLHKCPYNNITEIDMEYKFRKAIHEAKKRT